MRISSTPRKVHFSKEFDCPKKYVKRVEKLKKRIEKGEDISPYLSTGVDRIKNKDHLLYDWNIHHLHLGELRENKKFSMRTKELLFVYFTDKDMYFLTVLDHDSFADKKLLSIIHRNWPDLLKKFLLPFATVVNPVLTDDALQKLRKSGVTTFTQLESGEVYMPPGMGVVTTAESAKAVQSTQKVLNALSRIELEIRKSPQKFKDEILMIKGIKVKDLNIELKIVTGEFVLFESNSGYLKPLFNLKEYEEILPISG
jgi:hypothetical protein